MPGPKTTKFLRSKTYDAFYHLARELSAQMLVDVSSLGLGAKLLTALPDSSIPENMNPAPLKHLHPLAVDLSSHCEQTSTMIRDFFWPNRPKQHHISFNQQRWAPYDEVAWDTFFAEMTQALSPQVRVLGEKLERVSDVITQNELKMILKDRSAPVTMMEFLKLDKYNSLVSLLTETGVETILRDIDA